MVQTSLLLFANINGFLELTNHNAPHVDSHLGLLERGVTATTVDLSIVMPAPHGRL